MVAVKGCDGIEFPGCTDAIPLGELLAALQERTTDNPPHHREVP
jgi:hypothetical protein